MLPFTCIYLLFLSYTVFGETLNETEIISQSNDSDIVHASFHEQGYVHRLADQEIFAVTKRSDNQSTPITLKEIVDIWDPYAVADFWQNDTYLAVNISANCGNELTDYMAGLHEGTPWAIKLVDASGKHTSGLFSGNRYWLGSVGQCRQMEKDFFRWKKEQTIPRSDDIPPYPVSITVMKLVLEIVRPRLEGLHNIILAVCLPSSCETEEVESLFYFLEDRKGQDSPRKIEITMIKNLSKGQDIWTDSTFCIIMITTAIVIVFVVLGTFYDAVLRYQILRAENTKKMMENGLAELKIADTNRNDNSTISKLFSVKSHNDDVPKPLPEALLSFSLFLNLSKLMSLEVGSDTLAPIHGLRLFSLLWVIMVHSCLTWNAASDDRNFRKTAEGNFLYQTISNATYSVDTFFFMSGCLVAFLYYRTIAKQRFQRMKITRGFVGHIFHFLGMMWYRYCRLTPPYLLVIGLTQISKQWFHRHTVLDIFMADYETCKQFWWRNALYINTFFNPDERCMTWSWYMANDTQFYTVGIILLIIGASYISLAGFMTVFFLIASWVCTAIITLNVKHVPSIQDPFAHYDSLYIMPWVRIGPYLIGLIAGWFLCKVDCKLKINKAILAVGWSLCVTTMISIVYGLYGETFGPISAAMYTALSHSGWSLCIAWILIVCVTNHGGIVNKILSWKYLYPISRLCYCTYLIHVLVIEAVVSQGESSIHLSQSFIAAMFFGGTVLSFAAGLIISLLFEAPVVSLLRIVHPLRHWKQWK